MNPLTFTLFLVVCILWTGCDRKLTALGRFVTVFVLAAMFLAASALAEAPGPIEEPPKLPTVSITIEDGKTFLRVPVPDAYQIAPGHRIPVDQALGLLHEVRCAEMQAAGQECPPTPLHTIGVRLEQTSVALIQQLGALWRSRQPAPTPTQLLEAYRERLAEQETKNGNQVAP